MRRQRTMPPETQLKGVLKALASRNTPPHLREALARRATDLKIQIEKKKSRRFLTLFGF
jgi:hypothetical protein